MPEPTENRPPSSAESPRGPTDISRRELLAGAGAGAAALFLDRSGLSAAEAAVARERARQPGPLVFTHTTVVNPDEVREDVALAVEGDRIAAIGPTDRVLERYPDAETYDGRNRVLLPGLINCHAHMAAVVARGFNEDFGFPNTADLAVSPYSLLEDGERELMVRVAALEALKTGTTTIVEYTGNAIGSAQALADSGLRAVLAEGISDAENVNGPMIPERLSRTEPIRFSERMRREGMARIQELYDEWHGGGDGRITVFPAAALVEESSPELLQAVRAFAEERDLGYTIHLNQSRAEFMFMQMHHDTRPTEYLHRHGFLGPRLFAAHARYVNDDEVQLLGDTGTIISHQANMAANRGVAPPIPALRAAGCPIALGTDNNTNDVWLVMRIALLTERIRRNRDGDQIPGLQPQPEDILADCTRSGAMAVQQADEIGTLEVGKKADLLVVDTRQPTLVPAGRILSALIHCGHPDAIESTMVDGRFLMRKNEVVSMDEDAILAEADRVGTRIWDRVEEAGGVDVPRFERPS